MRSPYRARIAAQLKMSIQFVSCGEKRTAQRQGKKARPLRCPLFAYRFMSAGHFLQRQRKVTICALVQSASGLNFVAVVPLVIPLSTAHKTASR